MDAADIDVLVLNYDGRALLAECLPSIVRAAAASRHTCRVTVVDNRSSDDPTAWLAAEFPTVAVRSLPNDGLSSFNTIARELSSRVLVLLNNDIKLADDAIDPLVEPLLAQHSSDAPCEPTFANEQIFMTAPRCYLFDGVTYEGFKTSVVMRHGIVQATSLFAGCEEVADLPGPTASAGAALAVDRRIFVALGGFDPLYLPGRIEDLDFAYRGFLAGYQAVYIPEAVALHRGCATFGRVFGNTESDRLALRNTLLFQWKNLRCLRHRAAYFCRLPLRAARDLVRAIGPPVGDRFPFLRAYSEARAVWQARSGNVRFQASTGADSAAREREFFSRHSPTRLLVITAAQSCRDQATELDAEEARRAVNYPLARWYSRPAAALFSKGLAETRVRPWHLTLLGLICACSAAACLLASPTYGLVAAILVLVAWFFDRADGILARRQARATPLGAWLDANVDEAVDLGLHVCMAVCAANATQSQWPWVCLIGFLFGKYLLMYGLAAGETLFGPTQLADTTAADASNQAADAHPQAMSWPRYLYHLPANADVRIHLTAAALATGYLTAELALIACYYNARWIARFFLLTRTARIRATVRVVA
ncbi:MAG: CDP-alcohol phosphatidyltransferase family protein [Planctomycetia bacterium]|nr:CDP-alcohol phosphatidyltransferase family protein [Planctomycetia bacterium]